MPLRTCCNLHWNVVPSNTTPSDDQHARTFQPHTPNSALNPESKMSCSFCHRFTSEFQAMAFWPRSVGKNFISEADGKCAAIRQPFFRDTAVGKTPRTSPAIRIVGRPGLRVIPLGFYLVSTCDCPGVRSGRRFTAIGSRGEAELRGDAVPSREDRKSVV